MNDAFHFGAEVGAARKSAFPRAFVGGVGEEIANEGPCW
jgi:hypothetical protein